MEDVKAIPRTTREPPTEEKETDGVDLIYKKGLRITASKLENVVLARDNFPKPTNGRVRMEYDGDVVFNFSEMKNAFIFHGNVGIDITEGVNKVKCAAESEEMCSEIRHKEAELYPCNVAGNQFSYSSKLNASEASAKAIYEWNDSTSVEDKIQEKLKGDILNKDATPGKKKDSGKETSPKVKVDEQTYSKECTSSKERGDNEEAECNERFSSKEAASKSEETSSEESQFTANVTSPKSSGVELSVRKSKPPHRKPSLYSKDEVIPMKKGVFEGEEEQISQMMSKASIKRSSESAKHSASTSSSGNSKSSGVELSIPKTKPSQRNASVYSKDEVIHINKSPLEGEEEQMSEMMSRVSIKKSTKSAQHSACTSTSDHSTGLEGTKEITPCPESYPLDVHSEDEVIHVKKAVVEPWEEEQISQMMSKASIIESTESAKHSACTSLSDHSTGLEGTKEITAYPESSPRKKTPKAYETGFGPHFRLGNKHNSVDSTCSSSSGHSIVLDSTTESTFSAMSSIRQILVKGYNIGTALSNYMFPKQNYSKDIEKE